MTKIKIYGLGGQGVVTCGKLLAYAYAIEQGRFSQTIPAYGHERRGAPVYTNLILSEEPIRGKTFVYEPDYVMVFDRSLGGRGVDIFEGTDEKTVFFLNNPEIPAEMEGRENPVLYVDALEAALSHIGRDIPNTAMAGAFAAAGLITLEAVLKAIQGMFREKEDGANVRAAKACYAGIKRRGA